VQWPGRFFSGKLISPQDEQRKKNGFVARVATRRDHFQGRHKGRYLRP
jgi:hypothetical protein